MRISVAEGAPGRGVVVAEIDLIPVTQAIERARVGTAGYAYAVDARGELVTHSDTDLVLRHTNLASLPQVRDALGATAKSPTDSVTIGRDQDGTKVLSAFQTVEPLGWRVFVEQPLSEAFAPLKSAIWRTALLLVAFLLLAAATGVLLARRLVQPIESIPRLRPGWAPARSTSGSRFPATTSWGHSRRSSTAWPRAWKSPMRASSRRWTSDPRARDGAPRAGREEPRARRSEPAQVGVPGEHVARAANAAQRDHRLLAGAARADVRRGEREAGRVPGRHPSSAHHLLSLINDVLDLSKVEAGQIELDVAPFSLREALESGVVMVRERATQDGVRLTLSTDPKVDVIDGDERRIRQVIFNLLSNAVKFTPEGGAWRWPLPRSMAR